MNNVKCAGLILGIALGASACTVRSSGSFATAGPDFVVTEAPPEPRVVVMPAPRPGYVWVDYRWARRDNQWAWRDGRWERERVGHSWQPGRWERRKRGHVWVSGRWQSGQRSELR